MKLMGIEVSEASLIELPVPPDDPDDEYPLLRLRPEIARLFKDTDDVVFMAKPFAKRDLHDREQNQTSFKPIGFWYAKGAAWLKWVVSEQFDHQSGYLYKVIFDKSGFLFLDTKRKVEEFNRKYAADPYHPDWKRVAARYTGVEIAPYFWDLRDLHGDGWYYSVDVPSGCTWVPSETVKQMNGVVEE